MQVSIFHYTSSFAEYSNNVYYNVGDVVKANGKYYVCKQANSGGFNEYFIEIDVS